MKNIRLLINLYPVADPARRAELALCLRRNLDNPHLTEIAVLDEGFQETGLLAHPKIRRHPVARRPAFADFHPFLAEDGFNLIANNDIWFDCTLGRIRLLAPGRYDLIGLTRTEPDGTLYRGQQGDSQDCWLFSERADALKNCAFFLGVPGCESRLALEFVKKRYRFLNPARVIRTHHEHASEVRHYQRTDRLSGDYLLSRPVGLFGFHVYRLLLKLLQRNKVQIIKSLDEAD